jgi:hypothetical protein
MNLFQNNWNVAYNEVFNYHRTKYWPRNEPIYLKIVVTSSWRFLLAIHWWYLILEKATCKVIHNDCYIHYQVLPLLKTKG